MSIRRTVHGTWEVRWRDIDGRHRSKTLKTRTLAEKFERTVLTDTDRGLPTGRRRTISVRAFAKQWLAGAHNLREGGRSIYRRDLDRHILPALGDIPLHRLTPAAIDDFLAAEADAGIAASSRHRHWRTLRAMLNVAEDRDLIVRSSDKRNLRFAVTNSTGRALYVWCPPTGRSHHNDPANILPPPPLGGTVAGRGARVDNDAHELAELMMRRLERQDRIIDVLADEINQLKAISVARGETVGQILDMLRTMGDTCHAMAAAADRLTADR